MPEIWLVSVHGKIAVFFVEFREESGQMLLFYGVVYLNISQVLLTEHEVRSLRVADDLSVFCAITDPFSGTCLYAA